MEWPCPGSVQSQTRVRQLALNVIRTPFSTRPSFPDISHHFGPRQLAGKHHRVHLHSRGRLDTLGCITVRLEKGGKSPHDLIQIPETIRNTLLSQCEIGAISFILAAWIRYAGNANSLSPNGAYALLIFGQVRPAAPFPPLISRIGRTHVSSPFESFSRASHKRYSKCSPQSTANYGSTRGEGRVRP